MKPRKDDHRTRVTRLLLRRAFTELLQQKPIQQITVRELCEKAGVNRGTFYTHYDDIYDLLRQIEAEMLDDFRAALQPVFTAGTQPLHPVTVTTQIFRCLQSHADICAVTLGDYGDKDFALQLLDLGREISMASYAAYARDATDAEKSYFYAFVSAGCIGLPQKWIAEGMAAPAEAIAQMADAMMRQGIGFLRQGGEAAEK